MPSKPQKSIAAKARHLHYDPNNIISGYVFQHVQSNQTDKMVIDPFLLRIHSKKPGAK